MLLIVGASPGHLIYIVNSGADAELQFYEGTTVSDNGTELAENNMNRLSVTVSTFSVFHSPTVSGVGTLLSNLFIPGGTGGNSLGSQFGQGREWILDRNTNYLIRGINRGGNAQPMSVLAQWYES